MTDPADAEGISAAVAPVDRPPSEPSEVTPHPEVPSAPPGGRNVPLATAVGVLLAALVLGSLYLHTALFAGLATIACVIALWELGSALGSVGVRVPLPPLVVGGAGTVLAAYAIGSDGLLAGFALTCATVVAWRGAEPAPGFVRDASAGVFCAAYVPLLLAFGMLLVREDDGPERVVATLLLVVCSDTGGFFAGSRLGRHRMAPRISPKKSWEGFAGSVLLAAVVGAVALPPLLEVAWWGGLLVGLAVVVSATTGDLGESLVKRDLGVKDMSQLLPGHGGLLDRIDSVLATVPVTWAMFTLLL